jgi:restriction system protein
MTIPDFQSLMLPALKLVSDEKEHSLQEVTQKLAEQFQLTEVELAEMLPSGRKTRFYDRVSWATTFLRKAGLLSASGRGKFYISSRGLDVLKQPPEKITVGFLTQFDEFVEFRARRDKNDEEEITPREIDVQTPEEAIEAAYQSLRQTLAEEILQTVKSCSPSFFERLVIDVLVKMGYGGTRKEAGKAIGKSGDGGIDGIINEDRLGLDVIYIQAKKWENSVGRPEIQNLRVLFKGKGLEKESLSPLLFSQMKQKSLRRKLTAKSP